MSYCCLIGNGASIAYNRELTMDRLYERLSADFGGAGASLEALARYVQENIGEGDAGNFERLLGPLEWAADALHHLEGLVNVLPGPDGHLDATAEYLRGLRRVGLAHTLGHIARLAHGEVMAHEAVVVAFAEALRGLVEDRPGTKLTVASLNYDGLMHSGLLGLDGLQLADLASGRPGDACEVEVAVGAEPVVGQKLRGALDLPPGTRCFLVQLHGSLAWLRGPGGDVYRFTLDDLRQLHGHGYWECLREGHTGWMPVVVLTDRKDRTVVRDPFDLAYRAFRAGLRDADRWLVLGYGLGDVPVNEAVHDAFERHPDPNSVKLLVVGHGGQADDLADRAAAAFEVPEEQVLASVAGLPGVLGGPAWADWIG